MSIKLTDLMLRLKTLIDDTSLDYARLVRDGVEQLSQDAPMVKTATLAVVANTASYSLPSDYLFMIGVGGLVQYGDVVVTSDGLVPMEAQSSQERFEVAGLTLTITPTPTYTASRTYRYAARYVEDENTFPSLTVNGARVVLLYAQYLALTQKAQAAGLAGWKYQIGDEMVDKSRQGEAVQAQAKAKLDEYRRAVSGTRSYGLSGYNAGTWG